MGRQRASRSTTIYVATMPLGKEAWACVLVALVALVNFGNDAAAVNRTCLGADLAQQPMIIDSKARQGKAMEWKARHLQYLENYVKT